jgi:NADH-quinone oxidoreductase subunit N
LEDFQGVGYAHPWRGACFGFCLLSLAGLPPAGGFLGKLMLFWAVIKAGFIWLAAIGILTAIIAMYYYFKVLAAMYMRPPRRERQVPPAGLAVRLASALIFCLLFWLGTLPGPLLSVIDRLSNLVLR